MSWADFHARNAILDEALGLDPARWKDLPGVDRLFGGPDGVLAALQYRWNNHLAAKLDQAAENGTSPQDAWDELAGEQPRLRAVLEQMTCLWQPAKLRVYE